MRQKRGQHYTLQTNQQVCPEQKPETSTTFLGCCILFRVVSFWKAGARNLIK